ncbi:MAG: nuclease-related domain-containing protein [Desulfotomaculaceae bacterium]|nr:nuclease-related domain-containing protein [Desulfotomaculaceae bacterium]
MAETLRWPSSLIKQADQVQKRKANKNKVPLKFFVLGLLAGAAMFIFAWHYLGNTALGLWLSLSWLSVLIIIVLGRKVFSNNIESDKLQKGFTGEVIVAHALDQLPDGWFVINDIVIKGSQIDHLAVGPAGVYCLETKNWNNAGCDENGAWFRFHLGQWAPLNQSPAEQNMSHVQSVKKFLNERLGLEVSPVSVVVLANPDGKFNIKTRIVPPGDTSICLPSELHHLLAGSGRTVLPTDMVEKIAGALVNRKLLYEHSQGEN